VLKHIKFPRFAGVALIAALALIPAATAEAGGGIGTNTSPTVKGSKAKLSHGKAIAPANAPKEVQRVIAAANKIRNKPYVYGGGHGNWHDRGYDCSGAVSFALHGGKLMGSPLPSGPMMRWGAPGNGKWITIYANAGHAYMVVAGLRFDTSARKASGSRWTESMRSPRGYRIRHPEGL
jgi:hypothetical protein